MVWMNDTRSRILEATYELFCKHGAHVSLSQVSGALGIKKQSLYNYFPNKDALINEMLQLRAQDYFDELISYTVNNGNKSLYDFLKGFGHFCIELNSESGLIYLRRWISVTVTNTSFPEIQNLITELGMRYTDNLSKLYLKAKANKEIKESTSAYHIQIYSITLRGIINEFIELHSKKEAIELFDKFLDDYWKIIT